MAYHLDDATGDIIIDGWEKGIAKTPFDGIADMRNIDISTYPGCACVSTRPLLRGPSTFSTNVTFTADPATDIITVSASLDIVYDTGLSTTSNSNGRAILLSNSGGALPAGLTAATYYIINQITPTTFKLAATFMDYLQGISVNITGAGSGVQTAATVDMSGAVSSSIYNPETGNNVSFVLDSDGRVWVHKENMTLSNYTSGQWILITGNTVPGFGIYGRLVVYQDWLFVFRGTLIDAYGRIGNLTNFGAQYLVWYNAWKAIYSGDYPHVPFVGSDNKLYWGDKSGTPSTSIGYVGSLGMGNTTVVGATLFSDTNNPTTSTASPAANSYYNFNAIALDLPNSVYPTSFEELGANLMIGTNRNFIYPWDRISDTFSFPIKMPEPYISSMQSVNNTLYIFAGTLGVCYKSNGAQVVESFRVPYWMTQSNVLSTGLSTSNNRYTWGGTALFNGCIYFSVLGYGLNGIFKYDYNTDVITLDQQFIGASSINAGASVIIPITGTESYLNYAPQGIKSYQFMWYISQSSSSYIYNAYLGNSFNANFSDYTSTIITDILPVGTFLKKRTFQQIEFKLARPLTSEEGLKISYRTSERYDAAYTQVFEYLYDVNNPTVVSYEYPINIENVEWLQFKIQLKTRSLNSISKSLVALRNITIR